MAVQSRRGTAAPEVPPATTHGLQAFRSKDLLLPGFRAKFTPLDEKQKENTLQTIGSNGPKPAWFVPTPQTALSRLHYH